MRIVLVLAAATAAVFLVLAVASVASLQVAAAGSPPARAAAAGAAPAVVVVQSFPAAVRLVWQTTPGATGYRVVRSGPAGAVGGTCAGVVSGTSCTDTRLDPLALYRYRIVPLAGGWHGVTSGAASVAT